MPAGRKLQAVVRKRPAVTIRLNHNRYFGEIVKIIEIIIQLFMFRRYMVCSRSRDVFFIFRFFGNETDYLKRVENGKSRERKTLGKRRGL